MVRSLRNQAKLGRRWLRRARQMLRYRRFSLQGVPPLFANSFPKSGTHLLTQVLQAFPEIGPAVDSGLPAIVMFNGRTGLARPVDEVLRDLRRLQPGDTAYGHIHALPEAAAALRSRSAATYFILRDPRDVVVSHVHYITEMEPNHIHHAYYQQELQTFAERLRTSILGRPEVDPNFPDIRLRFEPYLDWLNHPEVLSFGYEDFLTGRQATLARVLDHALSHGFPLARSREQALAILDASIQPARSPTFRTGKSGGWREAFTPEHKRLFKDVTGDLLIRLGYETSQDW